DVLQIVERGAGRGDDVAALVHPPVLFEAIVLAGGGDELPHAQGLGRGGGERVVGALDDGQQRQFGRHAAIFEFGDDVIQIALAAFEHALDVAGVVEIPGLAVGDQRAGD